MKMSDDQNYIIDTLAYYSIICELEKNAAIEKEAFYKAREGFNDLQNYFISCFEGMRHEHLEGLKKIWKMMQNE